MQQKANGLCKILVITLLQLAMSLRTVSAMHWESFYPGCHVPDKLRRNMDVNEIWPSQGSISGCYRKDQIPIYTTIVQLADSKLEPARIYDLLPIEIVICKGRYIAVTGNRRLWAHQEFQQLSGKKVNINVIPMIWKREKYGWNKWYALETRLWNRRFHIDDMNFHDRIHVDFPVEVCGPFASMIQQDHSREIYNIRLKYLPENLNENTELWKKVEEDAYVSEEGGKDVLDWSQLNDSVQEHLKDVEKTVEPNFHIETENENVKMNKKDGDFIETVDRDFLDRTQPAKNVKEDLGDLKVDVKETDIPIFQTEKMILTTSKKSAIIWDVKTCERICILKREGEFSSGVFSPDNTRVVTTSSHPHFVTVWDVKKCEVIKQFEFESIVNNVVYSRDQSRILVSGDNISDTKKNVQILDVESGNMIMNFKEEFLSGVFNSRFSRDESMVAIASRDKIGSRIFEAKTGKLLNKLKGHTDWVKSVAFSFDQTMIATGSLDKTARIWNVNTGEMLKVFHHSDTVSSVFLSKDNSQLLTASFSGMAHIWDTKTGVKIHTFNSQLLTASSSGMAHIEDTKTGVKIHILEHKHRLNSAVFSHNETLVLTCGWDNTARLWEVQSELPTIVLEHDEPVKTAVFSNLTWDSNVIRRRLL